MSQRRERTRIRRSPAPDLTGDHATTTFGERLATQRERGGTPLDTGVRERMEGAIGHDFANVRLHADGEADQLNRGIGAAAFTLGQDIFLSRDAAGAGVPPDRLLAHELAHVVQQRGTTAGGRAPLGIAPAGDTREQEAGRVADATARGAPAAGLALTPLAAPAIQRAPAPSGGTLAPDAAPSAGPAARPTGKPIVEDWSIGITPGAGSSTVKPWIDPQSDAMRVSIGDTIQITPRLVGVPPSEVPTLLASAIVVPLNQAVPDSLEITRVISSSGRLSWIVRAAAPGSFGVRLSLSPDPGDADTVTTNEDDSRRFEITATAPNDWFHNRLTTAKTTLDGMYGAAEAWFAKVFEQYRPAYLTFDDALKAQKDADDRARKLMFDIFFGLVGGIAGGMAGGFAGGLMPEMEKTGKILKDALNKTPGNAIATTVEDLTKVLVGKAMEDPLETRGPREPSGPASLDPAKSGAARGKQEVPAVDPLSWYVQLKGVIAGERGSLDGRFGAIMAEADRKAALEPGFRWDWDPLAIIFDRTTLGGYQLDQLPDPPLQRDYERAFFQTWIGNYAGPRRVTRTRMQGEYWERDDWEAVGWKMRAAIHRAAQKWGENGEDWLRRYSGAAKAAAAAAGSKPDE